MSNFKNDLQELCQKNKWELPTYACISKGPAHQLEWYATASIDIGDYTFKTETVKPADSKVGAEKLAAQELLDVINMREIKPAKQKVEAKNDKSPDIIYLIDLENKPAFNIKENNTCLYIGFINSIHHSIPKYNKWKICESDNIDKESKDNNKLLYTIEGGVNDLSDHYMTAMIYPLLHYMKTNLVHEIAIISGDHAGFCTKSCIETIAAFRKITGIKIKNLSSI